MDRRDDPPPASGADRPAPIRQIRFLRISKMDFGFFPAFQNERQTPRRILSHTRPPRFQRVLNHSLPGPILSTVSELGLKV